MRGDDCVLVWTCVLVVLLLIEGEPFNYVEPSFYLCAYRVSSWAGVDGCVSLCFLMYVVCQIFDPGEVFMVITITIYLTSPSTPLSHYNQPK